MGSRTRRRLAAAGVYLFVTLGTAVTVFEVGRFLIPEARPPAVSAPPPGTRGASPAQAGLAGSLRGAGSFEGDGPAPFGTLGTAIAVPEPATGILWISGIAALYTLYLPPRSC